MPFIREFQKFFRREIPLITMEYWHRGEYSELRRILGGATHFNPLFIRNESGLSDVYYDMNNPETALQPLFDFINNDEEKFDALARDFEAKVEKLKQLLDQFNTDQFYSVFTVIAEAWGYLPIFVQLGSAGDTSVTPSLKKKSYHLRDEFQDLEYRAGEVLMSAIKKKFSEMEEYVDVISVQEVLSSKLGDLEELKKRKKGFIYFEGQVIADSYKENFTKAHRVTFIESLGTIGELDTNSTAETKNNILTGRVAYPGIAKGLVRIILTKDQLSTVESGDILVSHMTTPDFVPALRKVAAFVTDEGGITSHAAIVARELRVPCIIGTKKATEVLNDGDFIEVDANSGTVRIMGKSS